MGWKSQEYEKEIRSTKYRSTLEGRLEFTSSTPQEHRNSDQVFHNHEYFSLELHAREGICF
jgi:hypothetical protein